MRKRQAIVFAIFFFSEIMTLGSNVCAVKDSEGWTSLKKDVYIKKESIAYSDAGARTVSLWVKIVPDRDSAVFSETREHLRKEGKDDPLNAYAYTSFLSEVDCSRERHRELITILYDVNKNIIHSEDHPRATWDDILPGTTIQLVQAAVCRY